VLIAPWFLWAWWKFGGLFWYMIFSDAVVTRMTSYLDPTHVQPWYYYPVAMHGWLAGEGTFWLALAGLVVLALQSVRRRWPEGLLVLLWAVLPLIAISFGNSKLYHYTYPFLPPVALAAAYIAALALHVAPAPLARALLALDRRLAEMPRVTRILRHRAVRTVLLAIGVTGVAIAVVTVVYGPIRITNGSRDIFKSSGIFRPLLIAVVFGILAGVGRGATRVVVAVLVLSVLPFPTYRHALLQLTAGQHPMRAARDCIRQVQATTSARLGMYVDVPQFQFPYPHYYYFRTVQPWHRTEEPSPRDLGHFLDDPIARQPILVWEPTFQQFQRDVSAGNPIVSRPPMMVFPRVSPDVLLLLPGPYAACSAESASPHAG
jgi:4-amino-4-deoxy-L-arabinose transferase-like glycosyltransferase